MARPVQHPGFHLSRPRRIRVDRAGIGDPTRTLAPGHGGGQGRARHRLGDHPLAVERMDRPVAVAVEDDGRHRRARPRRGGSPLAHRREGRGHVPGRTAGEARMDAGRREHVRIGRGQDRRRRAAGRQTGDEDPGRIGPELRHHGPGDPGDQRRLAGAAALVAGLEPVPAFLRVGGALLARIDDDRALRLGVLVHPRAEGEVVGSWVQPCSITTTGNLWPSRPAGT